MSSTRKIGRLRLTEERLDECVTGLLRHYQRNTIFMADFIDLWGRNKRLLRALVQGWTGKAYGAGYSAQPQFAWDALERVVDGRPAFTKTGTQRRTRFVYLHSYRAELDELARQWGLRSRWAAPSLHAALIEPFVLAEFGRAMDRPVLTGAVRSYSWDAGNDKIILAIEVEDREDWKAVQQRILSSARRQWDALQTRWENRPDWERRDIRPELRRHISWLYLRICPQPDTGRPLSWGAIARRGKVGVTAITRVVKALAKEMEIDLPSIPAGRPTNFGE